MTLNVKDAPLPIPIILITGYLGSGKTTYLNRLLSEASGRKLAVLVNDFGAINIDASLVEGTVDDVIALQNGCICCSMAGGMQSAILKILKREEKPEAIVVEASGVANPGEVAKALSDDAMRTFAALELVISILDCVNIATYKPTELNLVKEQLRYSGIVMLSKLDQSSAENIEHAKELIYQTNSGSVVIDDYHKILNLDLLLGTKNTPLKLEDHSPSNARAEDLFKTWNYSSVESLSESDFQNTLNQLSPETVRGKGFLYLKEYPKVRFEFQMVGKSARVQPKGEWGFQNPRTEIVFIALKK